mmetsp:Transcript_59172/g.139371  ORF Transcript_59172/g.139371 Transcript_59172/m.139371 type:complete len:280 (-) Transcript_59172:70-909(-)
MSGLTRVVLCAVMVVPALVLGFPIELKEKGKIVAVPHGATMPPGNVAEATRRARASGKSVAVDISSPMDTIRHRKESHRQRMSAMTDSQISGSANLITGDGARPTRQPVDEVSRLLAMLPYALCILAVAVVFVICLVGRISKYVSAEQTSYFQDGKQSDTKIAPKFGSVHAHSLSRLLLHFSPFPPSVPLSFPLSFPPSLSLSLLSPPFMLAPSSPRCPSPPLLPVSCFRITPPLSSPAPYHLSPPPSLSCLFPPEATEKSKGGSCLLRESTWQRTKWL